MDRIWQVSSFKMNETHKRLVQKKCSLSPVWISVHLVIRSHMTELEPRKVDSLAMNHPVGGQFLLPLTPWGLILGKESSSNSKTEWDWEFSVPRAFKSDHLQPLEALLLGQYSYLSTLILGGEFILPRGFPYLNKRCFAPSLAVASVNAPSRKKQRKFSKQTFKPLIS